MSAASHNETLQPSMFSGSTHTPASRMQVPSRDPSTSKRVCFYKSGDPQFSGHRVVINSRTFKTFDALLDALSKKVPLPFGVRNITTPKGTHAIRSLDDLRDGASYVCSDQKRVKPLNLDEVNRKQVPWNTTRPTSAGRHGRRGLIRQLIKKNEVRRPAKVVERFVAVWTPKRLVVFKNRDPSTKRTIVLQRRTAPTFEALLDYLSQVLQFPVIKLYTADGRRVDGLPALILCSGIVVAAGNEPFSLGNYNPQGSSQSAISESVGPVKSNALPSQKKTSSSRSRNFSSSSEKYFVEQINKSLNGSLSEDNGQKTASMETDNKQSPESAGLETSDCVADIKEKGHFIMPSEDDIEKSFCVNQDGSMTVEMKVRLTVKHEEMIHWTTTLSRTCTDSQQRAVCSQPDCSSPGKHHYPAKEAKSDNYESSEESTNAKKSVGINMPGDDLCERATSDASDKPKPALRRLPTPGPRRVRRKEASVENIKMLSQTEVQESTVGAYSYMERTADGELTEGYCVVSRSSSSSTRPVPKPRKGSSAEAKQKKTNSSVRDSRMAEVLQLQNNGTQITETVMHIYESKGTYENYFANTQVSVDQSFRAKARETCKPDSSDSGPRSSSNDCDVDLTRQSTSSDSQNAKKNELLSLSSGQSSPLQKINNSTSCTKSEKQDRPKSSNKGVKDLDTRTKENPEEKWTDNTKPTMTPKSVKSKDGTSSDTTVSDKKQKGNSVPSSLKDLRKSKSPESQSHTGSEKKTVSSADSDKIGQRMKKKMKEKQSASSNLGNQKGLSETNLDNAGPQKSLKNVNKCDSVTTRDSLKSPIKKMHLDVLQPSHLSPSRQLAKPKSMYDCRKRYPEENKELTESTSMPVLCSSPVNVHQYVENWLKKIQPESVPYMDEMDPPEAETEARPKFWIGSASPESSEMRDEPEQDSVVNECASLEDTITETPVSYLPVEIKCEGDSLEAQRIRGFCKSMPSVRIHPAEQESHIRLNKSSQALINMQTDAEGEMSESSKVSTRSGVKPVLQQLCLSIQSIRRTSSHSNVTLLQKEKSSSLPDFSSQVASVFGAPSKALLSFLSLMTLKDDISSPGNKDQLSNPGSYPEALQVMQSLEKISNIEDEEELRASLTSLQSSTSSQLKKSWRDFQERNDTEGSPPLSPRYSEQEFALEVDSEEEDHDKEQHFGIQELMDELNMSEDLRREISSLVDGEETSSDKAKLTKKHSNNDIPDVTSVIEDATTKDEFIDEEGVSQGDVTRIEESDPTKYPVRQKSKVVEDVQTAENETCRTDPMTHEPDMVDKVQPSEEMDTDYLTCQEDEIVVPDPTEEKKEEEKGHNAELHAYTSVTDGVDVVDHHSEVNICQDYETEKTENELEEGDDRKTDLNAEKEDTNQETKECTGHPEAVDTQATIEAEHSELTNREECELYENLETEQQNSNFTPDDDSVLNENVNMSNEEEQNNDRLRSEDAEVQYQDPSPVNCISVSESQNSQDVEFGIEKLALASPTDDHDNDIFIDKEEEFKTDLEDENSDILECTADDPDPDIDCKGSIEDELYKDNQGTESKASECETPDDESCPSSGSGQESGHSDKSEKWSCKSRESESEQNDFQTFEEERDIEKQVSSSEEKCEESDEHEDEQDNALGSDKDVDLELKSDNPVMSDQEGEHYDQQNLRSGKSQECEAEHNPQMLVEEKDIKEDKLCNALDSEKVHTGSNNHAVSDQDEENSDRDKTQYCKSQESEVENKLQILKEGSVTGENEEDINEYEDRQSIALDCHKDFDAESEVNYSAMSDQDGEQSDQDKAWSCKSQESEVDHNIQALEKGNVTEGEDEEADDQEDRQSDVLDAELEAKDSAMSDHGEHSDQDMALSCKSQESEIDRGPQASTHGTEENYGDTDEPEDKQNSVSDSDKEFDVQSEGNECEMSDQDRELSDHEKAQFCKSNESKLDPELQTLEDVNKENEEKTDEVSDSDKDFNDEPKINESTMSDQDKEKSDQEKAQSCKSQESEFEDELQSLEEGDVTEDNDGEVDEHEDKPSNASDSEKDSSPRSDQDEEPSDQDKARSCKSQQSEVEHDLQSLKEGTVSEEDDGKVDEADAKVCAAFNSLDSESGTDVNSPALSDQDAEQSDQNKSESCKSHESECDADIEPDYPEVLEQVAEPSDKDETRQESLKSQESGGKQRHPSKVQETDIKTTSDEEKDDDNDDDDNDDDEEANEHVDKQDNASDFDENSEAQSSYSHNPNSKIKHSEKQEQCESLGTEALLAQSDYFEGVRETDVGHEFYGVPPMEISQELLDFVNLALLSSALTFTYDSKGHMRIEPENCTITEICDNQYIQRCLPSPNMSDLSDYRPETSDSGGGQSHVSSDLYTETGDEEVEKLSTFQGSVRQCSKMQYRKCNKTPNNGLSKNYSGTHTKQKASPSLKSINSFSSIHNTMANGTVQDAGNMNSSSSLNEDSECVQRVVFHSGGDSSEGILIDKGRWLLKENHLIRKSPPVPMGMYENVDTTSVDTGQDTSEDAIYPQCTSHHSPMAVISSSELEEMAKPPTPKCTYFNMPHSSDSDPFQENQSINSSKAGEFRKSRELKVCPMGETSKTWAKKNGSLPSFASVEFKLPDGKVHPEGGLPSRDVEKTARSQSISSRAAQEVESVEELNLRCGRHCPIL